MDSATIFFCGSRILQLFCHKVEAADAIWSVVKDRWKGNFSDLIDLQRKKSGLADLV